MKKVRGVIALLVSLGLAGMAALAVYNFWDTPAPVEKKVVHVKTKHPEIEPQKPLSLSQTIPVGMRVVTVTMSTQKNNISALKKGDMVDVLAVTPIPNVTEGRLTRVLTKAVQVLGVAIDENTGGRKVRNVGVSLLVTPAEASLIKSASAASDVHLVLRNPEDKDEAPQGAMAFTPVTGGKTFTQPKRDLTQLIAPGMRAITLEVSPTDGVNGVFQPEDRVDILVTSLWGNVSLKGENKPGEKAVLRETHRNSRIMLQNIKVIATDNSLGWQDGHNSLTKMVTLEVSPEDAEKLTVLADSKKGKNIIRLISRNQDDGSTAITEGAELLDLLSKRRPYMAVEIIRGPYRTVQTFYK
ncbi:MAG: Flp pilus assembly protein CpaB [Desulfobulbus propionicus]|nr:MAG: Flp pilus assembly protein CpaB [Desulfobulbus propionicus]